MARFVVHLNTRLHVCEPPQQFLEPVSGLQEEDDSDTVYSAQPYWLDRSQIFGHAFDSDLEKGDGESGSSGSGLDGVSLWQTLACPNFCCLKPPVSSCLCSCTLARAIPSIYAILLTVHVMGVTRATRQG